MNMQDFFKAVQDRLETGASAIFRGGKAYPLSAPADAVPKVGQLPVVSFTVGWTPDDTFVTNGADIRMVVSIIDHRGNGTNPLFEAMARVYGNNNPPSAAPTFGLHRHPIAMGVLSDNIGGVLVFQGAEPLFFDTDADAIGYAYEFTVKYEKGFPS